MLNKLCVLFRVWQRAMDDGRIDHGPETPPPLVANHMGAEIDDPAAMGGMASDALIGRDPVAID